MSIAKSASKQSIRRAVDENTEVDKCIFLKSLLSATMQDSGIRERRMVVFKTCYRSFKWSIILFSLTNISVVFQQFINNIFSDLLDICIIIYLDDILYSSTLTICLYIASMSKKCSKNSTKLVPILK